MRSINAYRPDLQPRSATRVRFAARLAGLVIALGLTGCDNVEWGGAEFSLTQPAPERLASDTVADTVALPPVELPNGPVLFHVRRLDEAGRGWIQPVLELATAELRPVGPATAELDEAYADEFRQRYYNPGQAYTLVAGGARVGTFVVHAPADETGVLCREHRAEGHLELVPAATSLVEFLAWPPGAAPDSTGLEGLEAPAFRTEMPEMARILGSRGVREAGLAGNWRLGAPVDLEPVLMGSGPRGFAATFMVGDSLALGSPVDSAGMIFMVADYDPSRGYFPLFFDAEWYGPEDKRALRWVAATDLVVDTSSEWLLQAYGGEVSWYEVVGMRDSERAVVWRSLRGPQCFSPQ